MHEVPQSPLVCLNLMKFAGEQGLGFPTKHAWVLSFCANDMGRTGGETRSEGVRCCFQQIPRTSHAGAVIIDAAVRRIIDVLVDSSALVPNMCGLLNMCPALTVFVVCSYVWGVHRI